MDDQTLLSDLCKICTTNPPKYCCPRCHNRTCSLPCYKRHKAWSSCSGKRDPGAYIKIKQLATPAGIDRDFNFITGIERGLDGAEREVEHRGIWLGAGGERQAAKGSNLQKSLDGMGVVVRRMPRGMSRQKGNKTGWHAKQKCISWTVEWVHPDGSRETAQCRENLSLAEAYAQLPGSRKASRKRKRDAADVQPLNEARVAEAAEELGIAMSEIVNINAQPPEIDSISTTAGVNGTVTSPTAELPPDRTLDEEEYEPPDDILPLPDQPVSTPLLSSTPRYDPSNHYYLHIPLTASKYPILAPLSPTTTLSYALQHRTVIEYPTIYVLSETPDNLPASFQLEVRKIQEVAQTEAVRSRISKNQVRQAVVDAGVYGGVGSRLDGGIADGPDGDLNFDVNSGSQGTDEGGLSAAVEAFQVENVLDLLQRDIEAVSKEL